jgi:hypothetical protein
MTLPFSASSSRLITLRPFLVGHHLELPEGSEAHPLPPVTSVTNNRAALYVQGYHWDAVERRVSSSTPRRGWRFWRRHDRVK